MLTPKAVLWRLISKAESLQDKNLLSGFEDFQEWRSEVCDFFQTLQAEFEKLADTPVGIRNATRFLQKTFQCD